MSLYVRETGENRFPSIVFRHGMITGGWIWQQQAQHLQDFHPELFAVHQDRSFYAPGQRLPAAFAGGCRALWREPAPDAIPDLLADRPTIGELSDTRQREILRYADFDCRRTDGACSDYPTDEAVVSGSA